MLLAYSMYELVLLQCEIKQGSILPPLGLNICALTAFVIATGAAGKYAAPSHRGKPDSYFAGVDLTLDVLRVPAIVCFFLTAQFSTTLLFYLVTGGMLVYQGFKCQGQLHIHEKLKRYERENNN